MDTRMAIINFAAEDFIYNANYRRMRNILWKDSSQNFQQYYLIWMA